MLLAEAENATFSSLHPGNTRWMAPEFVTPIVEDSDEEPQLPQQQPTKAGDIYSFGCVMLQVCWTFVISDRT
jgi:serine/threonine protein kinase